VEDYERVSVKMTSGDEVWVYRAVPKLDF